MSKLRVGIIGAGSISDMHFQSYHNHPEVELMAVCDLKKRTSRSKSRAV